MGCGCKSKKPKYKINQSKLDEIKERIESDFKQSLKNKKGK